MPVSRMRANCFGIFTIRLSARMSTPKGERLHPDLPIYGNREARIFAYWDHAPRLKWQTQDYYDS